MNEYELRHQPAENFTQRCAKCIFSGEIKRAVLFKKQCIIIERDPINIHSEDLPCYSKTSDEYLSVVLVHKATGLPVIPEDVVRYYNE